MSNATRARRLAIVLMAGVLSGAGARASAAQSLASRVEAVKDGTIALRFASRSELCGDGDAVGNRGRPRRIFTGSRGSDAVWHECVRGPAFVTIRRSAGEIVSVRTRITGRTPDTSSVTDLGTVSTAEAARYFLGLVPALRERDAEQALAAAAVADSVKILADLVRLVRRDDLPRPVRKAAVFFIAPLDEDGRAAALRGFVTDGDLGTELRGAAIIAMAEGEIADDDVAFLRRVYPAVDQSLKERIFLAVHGSDDPRVAHWLASVVTNAGEPMEVRQQALFWMGQGPAPIADLSRLFDTLRERSLREHFTFVLSQRHETAAVDKLIAIARNDPDRDIRRQAFFWLGQSKDERAQRFLREVLAK